MTLEIGLVLAVLAASTFLFVTERLRVDVVALLVLVVLTLGGLVGADQALLSFSNKAVITVGAVFVLSGGLSRTGVATILGRQVLRLAGTSERRLLVLIMSLSAFLSAFMNNVGVAALMLPVVMDIARQTGRAPSRLLIPLTYSSLLGGLNTLIGTSPNILISSTLSDFGFEPFHLFDYTPVGFAVTAVGIAFMTLAGPKLLPERKSGLQSVGRSLQDLDQLYDLGERLLIIRLHEDTSLAGRTLAQSRIGSALGLAVVAILRGKETILAPGGETVLEPGDRLLVGGQTRKLRKVDGTQQVLVEGEPSVEQRILMQLEMVEVAPAPGSPLVGKTLEEADFRQRFGLNVLAVRRGGEMQRRDLPHWRLEEGDVLVAQGVRSQIAELAAEDELLIGEESHDERYPLYERLRVVRIPKASNLVGVSLRKSRIGDVMGLTVLGIVRGDETLLMPGPEETLRAGDALLIEGGPDDLLTLRGLQSLRIDRQASTDLSELETPEFGLSEVILSPYSSLAGKTLRELQFREKFGLSVLAIWRQGRVYHTNLQNKVLKLGDALLLYGRRRTLAVLRSDPDFVLLTQEDQEVPRAGKAPIAVGLMLAVVLSVLVGFLPIYIAAIAGAVLMVLTGCLKIDEAYQAIQWRAVFLIAGMLSLGVAMEDSGAALFLAQGMVSVIGPLGPMAILIGFFIFTSIAAQIMPTAAVAVLVAPIAINAAQTQGLSVHALLMAVAMAASASFMSPVAHPANVMIMGPGGYRFTDYTKVGIPLTILMFIVVMLVLPLVWPLEVSAPLQP